MAIDSQNWYKAVMLRLYEKCGAFTFEILKLPNEFNGGVTVSDQRIADCEEVGDPTDEAPREGRNRLLAALPDKANTSPCLKRS